MSSSSSTSSSSSSSSSPSSSIMVRGGGGRWRKVEDDDDDEYYCFVRLGVVQYASTGSHERPPAVAARFCRSTGNDGSVRTNERNAPHRRLPRRHHLRPSTPTRPRRHQTQNTDPLRVVVNFGCFCFVSRSSSFVCFCFVVVFPGK